MELTLIILQSSKAPPTVGQTQTASLWSIMCITIVKDEKKRFDRARSRELAEHGTSDMPSPDDLYSSLQGVESAFSADINKDVHRTLTRCVCL